MKLFVKSSRRGVNFIDVYFREGLRQALTPFVAGAREGAGEVVRDRARSDPT